MPERCWIFGDESGVIHNDRFFAVGIVGTTKPKKVIEELKSIRKRTEYFDEVSYKSSNEKRILCCIRWMDWFFSGQDIAHFKILIKDSQEFDISYYEKNQYQAGASDLAYCESYSEVLRNFSCYNSHEKGFIYSQIGLSSIQLKEYLAKKIPNLA